LKSVKLFGKSIPLLAIVAIAIIASIATVCAVNWFYSNVVTVHVIEEPEPAVYDLYLTPEDQTIYVGQTATFTATLSKYYDGETTFLEGVTVELYYKGVADENFTPIDTGVTDGDGQCTLEWTSAGVGVPSFEAVCDTSELS